MRTRIRLAWLAFSPLLLLAAGRVSAACDTPAHRAFDFWVGEWQVKTPDGKVAGANRIALEYGGCVVHEHYTTVRGYSGESLNIYDASRNVWHQSWVDTDGLLLLLEGGIRDGKMVLQGQTVGADSKVTKHRITWTPNRDGSVRQFWESTDDKGKWVTAFDGLYTRV
jgi:hypothetical protein